MDPGLVRGELARRARVGLAVGALLFLGGCTVGEFSCHDDSQCAAKGKDGTCEPPGYCAFPDASCASGSRFGSHAGMGLANECTDAGGTTGASSDPTVAETTPGSESDSGTAGSSSPTTTATTTSTTSFTTDEGPEPVCGDGIVGGGEECDGEVVLDCDDVGFDDGVLACNADCTHDTSGCIVCGNGVVEGRETCDGSDLAGLGCGDVGFVGGMLGCTSDCTYDTSACHLCGNGSVDEGELCDENPVDDLQCIDVGLGGMGMVGCDASCQLDTSECGDLLCGVDPELPIGDCPAACTSCAEGVCVIECVGSSECAGDEIICPPGWPCAVLCDGSSACSSATVTCAEHFSCSMACMGSNACASAELVCSESGECDMQCVMGSNVCSSAQVTCGLDVCGSLCGNGLAPSELPDVACLPAGCLCSPCGE